MGRRKHFDGKDQPLGLLTKDKLRQALYMFQFVRPYRWSLIIGLVLLFLSSLVFMAFPYLSGLMIDIAQGKSKFEWTLADAGLILLLVLLVQGGISYSRVMLFSRVSELGIADVRKAVFSKLITMPMVFFEKSRTGELVSRLTSDVERLYNAFSITLAEFIRQIIILLSGIVFLALTTPRLALIMLATFPVIVVLAMVFGRFIRRLSRERQKELAQANNIVSEAMQAIQAVKAFTNEWYETLRYGKTIDRVVRVSLRYAHGRALFGVFIITVLFGGLFFIIWEGARMLQHGEITAGQLVSFVSYTAIIGGAIAGLGNFYTELLGAIGATERIREILQAEGEVALKRPSAQPQIQLQGRIAYEQVHFRYPTRPDVEVLKGISFQVEAGQKVALVGPSGAGKSTIVQLLLKFHKPTQGVIRVDGHDIFSIDTTEYRRHIAIVPQEVLLFGGTIRENIQYGRPDATEGEIVEAAKKANAWEFISHFPDGLDTIVGERGVKLSGGQRQRIAIARAILKDPAILLLDEATSSLDAESEKVVQEALNNLMQGRTSIIIAHRLATIREADQIFVIDDGRIVEQGTHESLAQIPNGMYNSLARLQFESV